MGKKKIIGAAALLVIAGSITSLYLTLYGLPIRIDSRPHEALGQVLAEEAFKLGGTSARVVLVTRDTSRYLNPAIDAQRKRFLATLTKGGGKIAFTHTLKLDPLRATAVPPGDFLQILKKAEESDVVVSFLGPPTLSPEQWASLQGKAPKVVAVCSGHLLRQIDLKKVFDQGLLRLAVVNKPSVTAPAPAVDSPQAWFEHLFELVTPANLREVVRPIAGTP